MKLRAMILIVAALIFTACSSTVNMTADLDKTKDFTVYKTYWIHDFSDKNSPINVFDQKRLLDATDLELAKRGLVKVEKKEEADLVVDLNVVLERKTQTSANTNHMTAGAYYSPWGGGMGTTHTTFQEYDYVKGQIIVDVYQSEGKLLVWQGIASKTVDSNPEERERKIQEAMAKLFELYPVEKTNT